MAGEAISQNIQTTADDLSIEHTPERITCADGLYLTQLNGIINISNSLDSTFEFITIFQERKDQKADEVYERLSQGFIARNTQNILHYRKIDISAVSGVQLELHHRLVILKDRVTNKVIQLYQSDKQNFCRGFYFDIKIGFEQLGLPAYEMWQTGLAKYLDENPITIYMIVSEGRAMPINLLIKPNLK